MDVKCCICKKKIEIEKWRYKKSKYKHFYCSRKCQSSGQSAFMKSGHSEKMNKEHKLKGRNLKCKGCRKAIYRQPWQLKRRKSFYCSQECYSKSNSQAVRCAECNMEIRVCNSYHKRNKTGLWFCSRECFYGNKEIYRKCLAVKRPTKPERLMMELIERHNLPYKYTGNGDFLIRVDGHLLNPDFINVNGKKEVLEVFGRYYHETIGNVPDYQTEKVRKRLFRDVGYKCRVIWDDEIESKNEKQILKSLGFAR